MANLTDMWPHLLGRHISGKESSITLDPINASTWSYTRKGKESRELVALRWWTMSK